MIKEEKQEPYWSLHLSSKHKLILALHIPSIHTNGQSLIDKNKEVAGQELGDVLTSKNLETGYIRRWSIGSGAPPPQ